MLYPWDWVFSYPSSLVGWLMPFEGCLGFPSLLCAYYGGESMVCHQSCRVPPYGPALHLVFPEEKPGSHSHTDTWYEWSLIQAWLYQPSWPLSCRRHADSERLRAVGACCVPRSSRWRDPGAPSRDLPCLLSSLYLAHNGSHCLCFSGHYTGCSMPCVTQSLLAFRDPR